jgi:tetratricopeptide (TPR) repeat protein
MQLRFWQSALMGALDVLTSCVVKDPNERKAIWPTVQARMQTKRGEYKKAEASYNEALALLAKNNDLKTEYFKGCLMEDLAKLYMEQNRYQESESKFDAALLCYNKSPLAKTPSHQKSKAECLAYYAILLRAMQQPERASQMEAQARELRALT